MAAKQVTVAKAAGEKAAGDRQQENGQQRGGVHRIRGIRIGALEQRHLGAGCISVPDSQAEGLRGDYITSGGANSIS